VALAADQIRLGNADLVLAGGTESMSMVPMMGHKVAMSPRVFNDDHVNIAYGMGITAEKVAEEWKVSREDQDAFAVASHQKALAAIAAGEFTSEISPYAITARIPDVAGNTVRLKQAVIDTDEGPRADTTVEGLGKLKPVFRMGGSVTAGNSSQMSDGAAGVLLASEQAIKDYGLTPLARFVSFSVAGVRPEVMGIGPIAAIPKGAEASRPEQGPTRLDRTERSLRGAGAGRDPRFAARPEQGEPAGRRDCARSPARRHRCDPHRDHRARPSSASTEVRHGDDVHRHRHGRGWDFRSALIRTLKEHRNGACGRRCCFRPWNSVAVGRADEGQCCPEACVYSALAAPALLVPNKCSRKNRVNVTVDLTRLASLRQP
jgi:hypothetical protein